MSSGTRDPPTTRIEAVPADLQERDRWVCWKEITRDGKPTKVPVDPRDGDFASATDPATWGSLSDAREYHDSSGADTAGVGFVFTPEDTLVGVDLDGARDPVTADPEPWAKDIISRLDSFTEVSPSGTGYHIYLHGIVPEGGNRRDGVEIYDQDRFFTFTGDHIDTTPATVNQRNESLREIHTEYVADDEPERDGHTGGTGTPTGDVDLSDQELLAKAKDAENGDTFRRLWRGDTSGYKSQSEADQALCNLLAFWTGGDRQRMDSLFRESGLFREKWDESRGSQTYGEITIASALEATGEYYDPDAAGPTRPNPVGNVDASADGDADSVLTPEQFCLQAGLQTGEGDSISDLTDRAKAAHTWELIKQSDRVHVRVHQETGALWAYDEGIWKPTGERALRFAARKTLNPVNYGRNTLDELKAQARADPSVEIDGDILGMDAGSLAVANGLLDLEAAATGDGSLRELEPEDYAIKRLPVTYDPDADATRWREFVDEVVEASKRDTLQEYVGYTLHRGEMPFNRAVLLVGSGANGKSTFLNVVRELLGPENTETKPVHKFHEENHVADLYGMLANIDADLSEGSLSGEGIANLKRLLGDDSISARHLYDRAFTFEPAVKHLYACNQVPDVTNYVADDDTAFWRRWLIVQFPAYIRPSERDPTLEDTLTADESLSGILNWAIEGWKRLLSQGGFTNADSPDGTRRLWQSWGDSADEFLANCVEHDPDAENITTGEAWAVYKEWCDREGKDPTGQHSFTNAAKGCDVNLGYQKSVRTKRERTPSRGYKHFGLTDDAPDLAPILEGDDGDDDADSTETRNSGLGSYQ